MTYINAKTFQQLQTEKSTGQRSFDTAGKTLTGVLLLWMSQSSIFGPDLYQA